jgi:hypothetical protein
MRWQVISKAVVALTRHFVAIFSMGQRSFEKAITW